MRVAIYARISTSDGRQQTENQIRDLREWAERLGASQVLEYVDQASGSKSDRESLTQCLADAHLRRFDVLLIWALDRLSREGIAQLSGYLEEFKRYGVRVQSHQETWLDSQGPISDLLIAIFGWVAKQERERFRERIKAGMRTAKAKGKRIGRPARHVSRETLQQLYAKNLSLRAIAREMGVSYSTIHRTLEKS